MDTPAKEPPIPANPSSKRTATLGNLGLVFAALLLCAILLEVYIDKVFHVPLVEGLDFHSFGAEYELTENRKLIYLPKPNVGKHNSYGHRGKEYSKIKGTQKRIVFIGDSVVEGLGVRPQERFTEVLETMHQNKLEIINLGVRGYNFRQEAEYLKLKGLSFHPDEIYWGLTFNDLMLNSGEIYNLNKKFKKQKNSYFYSNFFKTKSTLEKLLLKTKCYRFIKYRLSAIEGDFSKEMFYRILPEEQKEILEEMKKLSRKTGVPITMFFFPINTDKEKEVLAEFKTLIMDSHIPFVDLDASLSNTKQNRETLFFKNDPCHFSTFGNQWVAKKIFEFMNYTEHDLIFEK